MVASDSALVRVPKETHDLLRSLAREEGATLQGVIVRAVEAYERAQMLSATARAYVELRADAGAWREHIQEQALLDSTLMEGLTDLGDGTEMAAMYAEMNSAKDVHQPSAW